MILIGSHYTLVLCHSFKGCALPPSLLFHALFLSPIQTHKVASTIFWRDNQKIAGLGREILYNIQPPNPTQYWSHCRLWECPNSSPGVPGHHALTCLGSGPQKVVTPQPAWGSAETTSLWKRPSTAGAQLSEAPAVEAERKENPAQGKAHRAGTGTAESPRGSPSRLRRDNLSRTRSLGRSRRDDLLGPPDWSWASPRFPV